MIVLGVMFIVGITTVILAASIVAEDSEKPSAKWDLTRVNGSHVMIQHAGGEPIQTEKLTVAVDGNTKSVTWSNELLVEGETALLNPRKAAEFMV
jgi:hypothetical protein